jgi:hypothetical protein
MTDDANKPNALTVTDGFDLAAQDQTASPIRGTNIKFKDGGYYAFADKIDVHDQAYVVMDRRKGWQTLRKDTPPAYLMQIPGEPFPSRPHVDEKDYPLNLNGEREHPAKLTHYLYLLNEKTGEASTFWTNTTGGHIAIGELTDQVSLMRSMRGPGAMPVVALQAKEMPTQYGSTTPRPHFKILGWKMRDVAAPPQQLLSAQMTTVAEPSTSEKMGGDKVPYDDPIGIDVPKAPTPSAKPAMTKKGVQRVAGRR